MLPSERRHVRQEPEVDLFAAGDLLGDDFAELPCVPIDDDGGEEVETGKSVLLSLGRPVSDFAAPVEVDRALEGMVGLALVQPDLRSTLQINVAQPVEHEDRTLQAADFPERQRQAVLTRIGGEFPKNLTWHDGPGGHAGGEPQDIGPIFADQPNVDAAADQRLRRVRHLIKSGNVRQIAGSRRKPEAENGADGKNMIREAAGISIMLADLPSSIVRQQTM